MSSRTSLSIIVILLLSSLLCNGKQADVVVFEHSIRWTNENNFPHYLKLPDVREQIFTLVDKSLKQKFQFETLSVPSEVEYRVINGFGKPKISWPNSSGTDRYQVAILSAITRGTSNLSMFWSLTVSVRHAGKIIYNKAVNHELLPYTNSYYMNRQRWMEQPEFINLFTQLFEEALEIKQSLPAELSVNSKESCILKGTDLIPTNEEYNLYVADSVMGKDRHRIYQLRKDDQTLQTYIYRINDYVEGVYKESFGSAALTSVLDGLVNGSSNFKIPIPRTYSVLWNTLESSSGKKQVIRESRGTDQASTDTRETSPVYFFEVADMLNFNKDKISFAYFKVPNTNNEELSKRNFRPSGTYGTLGVTTTHILRGKNGNNDFELLYPEQDGILLITSNEKPVLAMPMINQNNKSRYFFHLKLADKNKSVSIMPLETNINSSNAQRYTLFSIKAFENDEVINSVKLIILMLHSIDWPPIYPQANADFEF
jgi:hypothetical protein